MKPEVPSGHKWCSGCKAIHALAAFGPDRSRPPLYLQGRCKTCHTGGASAKRNAARRAARIAADLDQIARDVDALEVLETRPVHRVSLDGFGAVPTHILAVPLKARWPAKRPKAHALESGYNFCDLVDGEQSRRDYREAGWKARYFAEQARNPEDTLATQQPPMSAEMIAYILAGEPTPGSFFVGLRGADSPCVCSYCLTQPPIGLKFGTIKMAGSENCVNQKGL